MTAGNGGKKPSLKKAIEEVAAVKKEDELDKKADNSLADERIKDSSSTRTLRETYAKKVYWYLVCYSVGAYALLIAQAWKIAGFELETTVIAIVAGSTAVSAIGLVGIVVRGLFK